MKHSGFLTKSEWGLLLLTALFLCLLAGILYLSGVGRHTEADYTISTQRPAGDVTPEEAPPVNVNTAGAEELAIFTLTDEKAAQTVLSALQQRVEDQRAALENYQPDEVGKLDNAIVEQRGASVLLLVPADADAAKTALDSLS